MISGWPFRVIGNPTDEERKKHSIANDLSAFVVARGNSSAAQPVAVHGQPTVTYQISVPGFSRSDNAQQENRRAGRFGRAAKALQWVAIDPGSVMGPYWTRFKLAAAQGN